MLNAIILEVFFPSASEPDEVISEVMLLEKFDEEVEGDGVEDGSIDSGVMVFGTISALLEGHVFGSVGIVLDMPMLSNGLIKCLCGEGLVG